VALEHRIGNHPIAMAIDDDRPEPLHDHLHGRAPDQGRDSSEREAEGDPETDPFMREFARREAARAGRRIARPDDAEAYGLTDSDFVDGPALPGETAVALDLDRMIDLVAADLVLHSIACARTFGDFHIALSGGRTPIKLYERLMYDPNCRAIPWRKTHLWIVEERAVPLDDPESTFGLIKETIVGHSDIPREQVHPITMTSSDAAADYERALRETLGWREKGHDRLDYVLLGLGADGSTAGLVPGSAAAMERTRLMAAVASDERPQSVSQAAAGTGIRTGIRTVSRDVTRRVTMTIPLFNAARFVAVLASGDAKADAIRRVVAGGEPTTDLPVAAIRPVGGQLKWYLDQAACGDTL